MATLAEVRKRFVRASKRYDLVVNGDLTTNTDNGANDYINDASRWLDMQIDTPQSCRWKFFKMESGDNSIAVENLLSLKLLTVTNSEGRTDITKNYYDIDQYLEEFPALWSEKTNGTPGSWTFGWSLDDSQIEDESADFTSAGYVDFDDITFLDQRGKQLIVFDVPADGDYTIRVLGKFRELDISADADENFWTKNYPHTLALAASYIFEQTMKNDAGMTTWLRALQPMLDKIESELEDMGQAGLEMYLNLET